jgi:hypothetical protein
VSSNTAWAEGALEAPIDDPPRQGPPPVTAWEQGGTAKPV